MENTIKLARKAYGLTQEKMAELMNVPVRTLQNWENGVRRCSPYMEHLMLSRLEDLFERPDYKTFLEELLQMIEGDLKYMQSDECKQYACNLIGDIKKFLW